VRKKGYVVVLWRSYLRYAWARIGIYSPAGQKVGQVLHLYNEQRLFIVGPYKSIIKATAQEFLKIS